MPNSNNFLQLIKKDFGQNSLNHAYLVLGTLECEKLPEILDLNTPDVLFLGDEPIKINHIRELIHWLSLKPHSSKLRLICLKNIQNMTLEAANALLKILEEPPVYAIIILQANRKEKILPTILSRCQIVREQSKIQEEINEKFLPSKIAKMLVKERFDLVNLMLTSPEEIPKIINSWEAYFRQKLIENHDERELLNQLSYSRRLLSTNTSLKLLLENLILKF